MKSIVLGGEQPRFSDLVPAAEVPSLQRSSRYGALSRPRQVRLLRLKRIGLLMLLVPVLFEQIRARNAMKGIRILMRLEFKIPFGTLDIRILSKTRRPQRSTSFHPSKSTPIDREESESLVPHLQMVFMNDLSNRRTLRPWNSTDVFRKRRGLEAVEQHEVRGPAHRPHSRRRRVGSDPGRFQDPETQLEEFFMLPISASSTVLLLFLRLRRGSFS